MKRPIINKPKDRGYKTLADYEINITGNRDPRSPDVDILVKVNELDQIEITIPKSDRCYRFHKTIDEPGFTKMIFS